MTLSETKQTAVTAETFGDGVALLNLGHRDGEAPIVPSLERVRHRDTASEFPPLSSLPHPPHRRMLSCLFFNKTNLEH